MNKNKPVFCPHCKKEIELLTYEEDVYGRFSLNQEGEPHYNPKGGNGYSFSCPECYAHIAECEEDAIDFLNGKKIKN